MAFRHDERTRAISRAAYLLLEPMHLITYWGERATEVAQAHSMRFYASYVGFRAAPMGNCAPAVVTSAFYNWNPAVIEKGWTQATEALSIDELLTARETIVDRQLRDILGDRIHDDTIADMANRLGEIYAGAISAGRPLGGANAVLQRDLQPHVALWQYTATMREWRGDAHIDILVAHNLAPTEVLIFHGSDPLTAPQDRARGLASVKKSRSWDDDAWEAAADALRTRGLLRADDYLLTDAGVELYELIEAQTDDAAASVWDGVADAEDILESLRPYVQPIIDSGLLLWRPMR